jgi:hypothetical protein
MPQKIILGKNAICEICMRQKMTLHYFSKKLKHQILFDRCFRSIFQLLTIQLLKTLFFWQFFIRILKLYIVFIILRDQ